MEKKIIISLVSYLNTKPFLYGLQHSAIREKLDLQLDIPSVGGKKILENKVDIGLVPVAVLAQLDDARIISDYCIGADGPVKSVCVYAERPIEELDQIFLDHHSLTSVQLLKILLREYWKVTPALPAATEGYIDHIAGSTGGLVIGDRAIRLNSKFPYVYDLAEAWKSMTGLPFVFAAWITRKQPFTDNLFELNEAFKYGVHHIGEVAAEYHSELLSQSDLADYLTNNIDYNLNADKRRALDLFLSKIKNSVMA